ncbi:hypothetical protein BKA82DRAFT_4060893 [Pisolithus tinctorius]|nr:hypothetical protein BKA82DRAFT_4060893 [Pisolithus tinctorius]
MDNLQASYCVQNIALDHIQQAAKASSSTQTNDLSQKVQDLPSAGPSTIPALLPPKDCSVNAISRSEQERQIIQQTAAGFAACLAADHAAVLHPDIDSPFADHADVVNRLLPYHIFQQPQEDTRTVAASRPPKGKEKAKYDDIRLEIKETRFALNCHQRLRKLQERFRRAQVKDGTRASPDPQAYTLIQAVLEVERAETAAVSSELRSARNELDAIQREKRAASQPTVTKFRSTYYPQGSAPSQYYRSYAYAYTQPYSASIPGATTSTFYTTPPARSTTAPATASGAPSYVSSGGAIPVQLPVTSLSALHALGIVPIPAASLPPPDQPQPAAVLKGSTSNGTMLSLDINVSLLQSSQMSGLALLLNSLMSRGGSSGQASAAAGSSGQAAASQPQT